MKVKKILGVILTVIFLIYLFASMFYCFVAGGSSIKYIVSAFGLSITVSLLIGLQHFYIKHLERKGE